MHVFVLHVFFWFFIDINTALVMFRATIVTKLVGKVGMYNKI